ncbi:DnaD domain protein [Clostridium sp. DJ247]|uniref:DnaD domain protein n=1 Tax=Clostridium sp. DJ247 TaxID=2726188 RepID=UPI0016255A18|nr:DnaD domain protein [Clostridium sp. DJ247]MBC2579079.1 DnaD domain protein [Clostridium sp. DJ247]
MAVYRQVQITYWHDSFVMELTPEEKYFYIYLLTNSETTQSGIFEIPKRIIEMDLGYNRETVNKLIKRFQDYGKILYCEAASEIMILNWMKYNFTNSKNTMCCINKELKSVKNKDFLKILYKKCLDKGYNVEAVFKGIALDIEETVPPIKEADETIQETINQVQSDKAQQDNPSGQPVETSNVESSSMSKSDNFISEQHMSVNNTEENINNNICSEASISRGLEGACKPLGEEETKEKEETKKEASNKQKVIDNNEKDKLQHKCEEESTSKVLLEFDKNIRQATIRDVEKIKAWLKVFEEQVIIQAILEAVKYQAPHTGYVESVIKNWRSLGLFTMEKLKKYRKKSNKQKRNNGCNADAYRYLD